MNLEEESRNEDVVNRQPRMDDMYEQGGPVYDYNYSISDILTAYDEGMFASSNVGIFLCLCGITFNVVLITLILGSETLRTRFIYIQIVNIAFADLGFVITVDCFSVYNDLHKWTFGATFCKAWMILDVALPTVSIISVLFLNVDRVLFMYKTKVYGMLVKGIIARAFVFLYPWLISSILVCSLWLGFSEVEPKPELCVYGITKEANTASTWLTVFLPAFFIVVLVVFVFIGAFGEMPNDSTSVRNPPSHRSDYNQSPRSRVEFTLIQSSPARSGTTTSTSTTATIVVSDPRKQRRMVVSILIVDFVSILLSLPFTALSHVSPVCNDRSSCQSLITLFQSLSWMRSSVTCFRPLLFILLTQARFVCVREDKFCCCQNRSSSNSHSSNYLSRPRHAGGAIPADNTSSSQNNQQMTMTSLIDTQRPASSGIHTPDVVSTGRTLSPPNSPNKVTNSKEVLSFTAKPSVSLVDETQKHGVTLI